VKSRAPLYSGFIFLLGFAALLSAQADSPAPTPSPTLTVENAWVRVTPGVDVAAAYMTLSNHGTHAVVVIGVQSALAGHAMIHESKIEGGLSTMRPHERLVVPAGGSVQLMPGGLHIMLHMLNHTPAVGEEVPLVLQLEGGGAVNVSARVRPLTAD
jgi:periplasmic copper chaperone A